MLRITAISVFFLLALVTILDESNHGNMAIALTDTTKPNVAITSPASNAQLNTSTPLIQGTSSDSGSGIKQVQVKIGNGAYTLATGTTSWSYTTSKLSSGSHTVTAKATDNAGNTAVTSITFTIDATAPKVSITSPANNAQVNTGTPFIQGTSSDSGSGVKQVQVKIGSGSYALVTGTTSWSYTPSTSLSAGSHTVTAKVTDNAGNTAVTSSITFTIDTTDPTVSITSPANNAQLNSGTPLIQGTASDASLQKVEVGVDSGAYSLATGTTSWSYITSFLSSGPHIVTVKATDNAGNTDVTSITITVNSIQPPGMTISQLYNAIQTMTPKPKIAYVEPTYTSTAYGVIQHTGHVPGFYDFYALHYGDPLNTPIYTDLNLLTQTVRTTLVNQSGLQTYNLLSSLNSANSLGVQISMLTDTDVHNGVIFDSQNHNLYNTLILAHQEYVTQQEYNNLKTFVNNGGNIIIVDGNAFGVEVTYNSAQNTISLLLGHNFQNNGTFAMHVSTNDRYGQANFFFIGGSVFEPQPYTLGYNPFDYTPYVLVGGQEGEENDLRNSAGKVIIDYKPSISAKITSYEFDYGQGRVYHMGIYGDNVIGNSNYQQYLNYLIARSLNLTS